jgi:hypothetical protein
MAGDGSGRRDWRTLIRAACRERGFFRITISTSKSAAVNKFISRSREKPASLYWRSAETLGGVMPSASAAAACALARFEYLIHGMREAQPSLTLGSVGNPGQRTRFLFHA